MKSVMASFAVLLLLAGCSAPGKPPALQAPVTGKINPARVQVTPSNADIEAAKASLFTAIDADGVEFDSLFGTAANPAGDDLAVCGFASRDDQDALRCTSPTTTANCCCGMKPHPTAPVPKTSFWR